MQKLGATSRAHAIVLAIQNGIYDVRHKRSLDTFVRGYDKYLLCIFCGKGNLNNDYSEAEIKKVKINHIEYEMFIQPKCPTEGCKGDISETIDWDVVREHHPEYPEVPEHGVVYDYDIEWFRGY